MTDSIDPIARNAAAKLIAEKRDELLRERERLTAERTETLSRLRRVDREISDCRAAARLFDLQIEFPPDDRDEGHFQVYSEAPVRSYRSLSEKIAEAAVTATRLQDHAVTTAKIVAKELPARWAAVSSASRETVAARSVPIVTTSSLPSKARPPIRDIVLDYLRVAGPAGSKTAPIREFIERTYGDIIHEKTVGMTLYRLSKEGFVRRAGHTWFSLPPKAEEENPGVAAPGLNEMLK